MKWTVLILVFLFVGWKMAVFLVDHNSAETEHFVATDSLQAKQPLPTSPADRTIMDSNAVDTVVKKSLALPKGGIDTKGVVPGDVVAFAKTQIGVPYLYGSTDPTNGFDCSGFISYVFKKFDIAVPRSSIDFTNAGTEIIALQAKEGDLILFTGTDSTERFVGHMGIVVENGDSLRFIHSSSGRANGVTITPLNNYYQSRYVKTVRIFP